MINKLEETIQAMTRPGTGILAADESTHTITKRLQTIDLDSTPETRREYREMLFTTPGLGEYISGAILYEETLEQKTQDDTPLPEVLNQQGILPGIKVDIGAIDLYNSPGDKITQGIDGLADRLMAYKSLGARFAKWRAVLPISDTNPHRLGIMTNAETLARYASICQQQGIVPIVEPELLMDGNHTIERCEMLTEWVLHMVFCALYEYRVFFEGMILKPNMVISGKECPTQASVNDVAAATLRVLRRTVPAAVPTINFLSGGQSDELATTHLNAMNQLETEKPWQLSFSYGRALQSSALKAWKGQHENIGVAQEALLKRAKLNSLASLGKYEADME